MKNVSKEENKSIKLMVRVSPGLNKEIQSLMNDMNFETNSQFLRLAITELIKNKKNKKKENEEK